MARNVARFEKVSFEVFSSSMKKYYTEKEFSEKELLEMYDNIEIPSRATKGSVGYDFLAPFDFTLVPGSQIMIPTGIRCVFLKEEWGLFMMPKSRNVKTSIRLSNTIGVIDTDYYESENTGHIMIFIEYPANPVSGGMASQFGKILNKFRKPFHYNIGDGFVQGIFHEIGLAEGEDIPEEDRTGGFGSTGNPNDSDNPEVSDDGEEVL